MVVIGSPRTGLAQNHRTGCNPDTFNSFPAACAGSQPGSPAKSGRSVESRMEDYRQATDAWTQFAEQKDRERQAAEARLAEIRKRLPEAKEADVHKAVGDYLKDAPKLGYKVITGRDEDKAKAGTKIMKHETRILGSYYDFVGSLIDNDDLEREAAAVEKQLSQIEDDRNFSTRILQELRANAWRERLSGLLPAQPGTSGPAAVPPVRSTPPPQRAPRPAAPAVPSYCPPPGPCAVQ
jgi:hypothetical protein